MRRGRPANLTLKPDTARAFYPVITLEDTDDDGADADADCDVLQLSPSSSSSDSSRSPETDDLSKDLADLARLRKTVQQNLRLRPIRSFSTLPQSRPSGKTPPANGRGRSARSLRSPSSSSATSSVYYTPVEPGRGASPASDSPSPERSHSPPPSVLAAAAWDPAILAERLSASKTPILVDTRPYAVYQARRIAGSVNVAIPSLILKRFRKPGSGFHSFDSLRQFITSEDDKKLWDTFSDHWDGDIVVVHGDETDESEKDNLQVTAWALLPLLSSLLGPGHVHYLRGGMTTAQQHPKLSAHIDLQSPPPDNHIPDGPSKSSKGKGVFQINTATPSSTMFVESRSADEPTSSPSRCVYDHCPRLPARRPSAPNLSYPSEQHLTLPRLQIRVQPTRSATMPIASTQSSACMSPHVSVPPQSPSHLTLLHSNHTPPALSPRWTTSPADFLPPPTSVFTQSAYTFTPPRTPRTPDTPMPLLPLRSPGTSRPSPPAAPSTGSDAPEELPSFSVSTILPGFLYLGPELTLPDHVAELKELGIRRILNIAAECDADDYGLDLHREFERYVRIPMRDTVDEAKVRGCLRVVCETLDEAALYNAPTFVHCKAGRSRSVAAVMAYLIHAHRWPLSRAYAFVVDRRRGVSPNIGFVSELMAFEARELGGRPTGPSGGTEDDEQNGQGRRLPHARESLPPMLSSQEIEDDADGGLGVGQDMEVKDAEGRWRHVRRAPVDETTLQPMRRVSKAGLESTAILSVNDEPVTG
ncbi:hypothetical protein EDD17DRAFT_1586684 [Pisolithus thermaeus]|nr:hypothetical protein EDD17DRAFT_1586684 [Pisolithus thermaeus]